MRKLRSAGRDKQLGFTIVEIMTVVIISALLLTIAIPGYENIMRNNEAYVLASRLSSSLNLARAEAIKKGIPVTVCPISSTFNATSPFNETTEQWPCQGITAWDAWKVFDDPNFSAVENFSNGWPIIQYVGNNPAGTMTSNISGPITFDPMGFTNLNPSASRSGWTWSSSYSSGEWQWSYAYNSAYTGSYSRVFTIAPAGCTGNNALSVTVSQNGVISTTNTGC